LLGFAGWKAQFLLQWNRPAAHFGYRRSDDAAESREAAAWLSQDEDHRLVLPRSLVEPCFDLSRVRPLGFAHRQHWVFAEPSSVLPTCAEPAHAMDDTVILYEPADGAAVASWPVSVTGRLHDDAL
jgi:hypothetical protein